MGMSRGGGGGIAAAIQRGRQQRAGPRGGMAGLVGDARQQQAGIAAPRGPVMGGERPVGGGYQMGRGAAPPIPRGGRAGGMPARMQQQAMLAQQMRRGAAPNMAGGRVPQRGNPRQQRAAMGGGRRY